MLPSDKEKDMGLFKMCIRSNIQHPCHTEVFQAETHISVFLGDDSPTTDCSAFTQQLVMQDTHCCEELNRLLDQHLKSHSGAKSDLL